MSDNTTRTYYKLSASAPFSPPIAYAISSRPLDAIIDLSHWFGPIENQLTLGACTAFAATQWYGAWQVKHKKPWVVYSQLAQYWEERYDIGTVNQDSGAPVLTAVQVLCQQGIMPEQSDPYVITAFENAPSSAWLPGSQLPYDLVRTVPPSQCLQGSLDAINNGYPVLFGFSVFKGLESLEVTQTGVLPMPLEGEQPLGGHAVVAVGFNHATKMIRVRNQWGANWGQAGYFEMPYLYYSHYVTEAYVIEN